MNDENKPFKDNLDKLIHLFKKLRDKSNSEEYSDLGTDFFKNLDALVENYDLIKDTFPEEMINQVGQPIKEMIEQAIEQLKEELGDVEEVDDAVLNNISEIDDLLKRPNISSQEIDELLDRRAQIIKPKDE